MCHYLVEQKSKINIQNEEVLSSLTAMYYLHVKKSMKGINIFSALKSKGVTDR